MPRTRVRVVRTDAPIHETRVGIRAIRARIDEMPTRVRSIRARMSQIDGPFEQLSQRFAGLRWASRRLAAEFDALAQVRATSAQTTTQYVAGSRLRHCVNARRKVVSEKGLLPSASR